jgi:hypothetical protein
LKYYVCGGCVSVKFISFGTVSCYQQCKIVEYARRKFKYCNNKIATVFPDGLIVTCYHRSSSCYDGSPVHRCNLANGIGGCGGKLASVLGNLRSSQGRKRGMIRLKQSLIYMHPFPTLPQFFAPLQLSSQKLFLVRKKWRIFAPPPHYAYAVD